jgi:hypothetical protein
MRGRLVVDAKLLKDHFLREQRGGNIPGLRGARMQRGYGIGGIFKSLARYAIPLFKQGAKVVGKRALQTATEVGQDVLQGNNVKEAFKSQKSCRKRCQGCNDRKGSQKGYKKSYAT